MLWRTSPVLVLLLLVLSGCATTSGPDDRRAGTAAEQYRAGVAALDEDDRAAARERFEALIERHATSRHAGQARAELAWLHYRAGELDAAREQASRMAETHPDHPSLPYALYVAAMAAEQQWEDSLARGEPDQRLARRAFADYRAVVDLDAEDRHAGLALEAMSALREAIARHELDLARTRLEDGAADEALDRARYVGEHYPRSETLGDAMALQINALESLGEQDKAGEVRRMLRLHQPDHPAVQD
ncbi:outer membrane protein assembly factor BamD [Alkalilimnicola ehrlichii MLHE-1]|uniref:DNA uptake lipoprotein-like protein n=1 Tax=Alkalilimnicola ehrlichii (strain ATCC BAA-1101 / DSM 17681 / MLHE-1) TaxID=187272 RepID=Q0A5Z4_ALKEH|nr:outer membrane protein assembly factor BamD [Alkalilimnicola ehrlichii]ABI57743.1 DNA uptake lipoprotein-like protein [Alkalilimnicola ehrlichii MLHE-1]